MLLFLLGSLNMWGTEYELVYSLNCATASANGSQSAYGVNSTTVMAGSGVKAFLNAAAGSTLVSNDATVSGSVYWAKGSGGPTGTPDNVLKVGKASGDGSISFTIGGDDNISKVVVVGYVWKTTSSISVNSATAQTYGTTGTSHDFIFEDLDATKTISISVTTSAVCVTGINLYKTKSGGGSTPSISLDPSSLDLAATGNAQQNIELTATNFSGSVNSVECAFFSAATCQPSEAIAQPEWITSLSDNNSNQVSFNVADNGGAARNIWMKITASDGTGNASAVLAIAQAKYIGPASLPFAYDGNGTGDLPNGLEVSGTGTYGSSPAIKFDGTGDYVIIYFSDAPGKLTYDIKGNTFSGGTFTVQESEDGETYTDVAIHTELGATESEEYDLNSASRYVKFIYTNKSSGNVALGNIAISAYDPSEPCATPAIAPAGGTYDAAQSVTITCATEGATIYYTTDGSNPTTSSSVYSSAINVSSDMTIKAIAAKAGYANSNVATETYEINLPYGSIAEFIAGEPTTAKSLTLNNAIITGVDGTTLYIQDETAGIMIYGLTSLPENAAPNHSISGTIVGKYSLYKNQHELVKPNNTTPIDITNVTVSAGEVARPAISEYTSLSDAYAAKPMMLVTLKGVNYDGTEYVFEGNKIYNTFGALTDKTMPETTVNCDITGVVIDYNGTLELLPVFATDIVADADAADPTVSPAGGADAENAVTAAAVEITAAANTKVNGLDATTIDINSTTPAEVSVTVTRDFYRSVNYSCGWYKAAAAKYDINGQGATTEGAVVAKVAGVDAASAAEGDEVHILITPNTHFELATITVNGVAPTVVTAGEEYSFTMPGAAVTIAVTWTEDEKYALTFTAGEGSGDAPAISGNEYYAGDVIPLPANTFTYDAQHKFTKWLIGGVEYAAGVNYTMPAATTEAVAQWDEIPDFASGDWILVEDVAELTEGSYVIIAAEDYDYAMIPYSSGNNCGREDAVKDGKLLTYNAAFAIFEIKNFVQEEVVTGKSFLDVVSDKYLYSPSANNYLKTKEQQDAYAAWNIEISEGTLTAFNKGNTAYEIQYNTSGMFSCYKSTQQAISLYKYHVPSLKLSYDKNTTDDVTNLPGMQVADGENKVTVSSEVPLRENYIFNGWKDSESNAHAAGAEITLSANMTLYAQWRTPDTYSISYDANGGTLIEGETALDPENVTEGNSYTVKANVYKVEGKIFMGWKAADVIYNAGQVIHPTEDMAFVAQWGNPTVTDFVLVTDVKQLKDGDKVYIVADGNYNVALGELSGSVRNPVEIAKQNNHIVNIGNDPVELTLGKSGDDYTFYDGANYLAWTSGNSLTNASSVSDNSTWNITINEGVTKIANKNTNTREIRYNSGSPRFAAYAGTQQHVSIYKRPDYSRDVTEGRFGTICLPKAGKMDGAELFEIAYYGETSKKIFFDNIPSGEMEAGIPYIFLPNAGIEKLGVYYSDNTAAGALSPGSRNGLIGSYTQEQITANDGNYILLNNQYCEVVTTAEPVYVGANRAYIKLSAITSTEPALAPGRRRISMGVQSQNAATGMDELNASETPVKMLIDGQLFILRGEKMYNANGQLVK